MSAAGRLVPEAKHVEVFGEYRLGKIGRGPSVADRVLLDETLLAKLVHSPQNDLNVRHHHDGKNSNTAPSRSCWRSGVAGGGGEDRGSEEVAAGFGTKECVDRRQSRWRLCPSPPDSEQPHRRLAQRSRRAELRLGWVRRRPTPGCMRCVMCAPGVALGIPSSSSAELRDLSTPDAGESSGALTRPFPRVWATVTGAVSAPALESGSHLRKARSFPR